MIGLTNDFTTEEIQEGIKTLKKRKSPGCDNMLNEHLIDRAKAAIEGLCVFLTPYYTTNEHLYNRQRTF